MTILIAFVVFYAKFSKSNKINCIFPFDADGEWKGIIFLNTLNDLSNDFCNGLAWPSFLNRRRKNVTVKFVPVGDWSHPLVTHDHTHNLWKFHINWYVDSKVIQHFTNHILDIPQPTGGLTHSNLSKNDIFTFFLIRRTKPNSQS